MVNSNKSIVITSCRSCGSEKLYEILSLGIQYLSDFSSSGEKPEKYPLELVLCRKCNLLQLRHTAPKTSLYTERYGYRSGINNTMRSELREIVNKSVGKAKLQKKSIVVDIGANDGTLLAFYHKDYFRVGIEPIKKFAKECRMHADIVINDFFNYKSYSQKLKNRKAQIVTAISCFYDIDNPNQFLTDVKKILDRNGIFIIQQNYLVSMLQQNAFDNIVHEHLEYYSLLSLEYLLNKYDLEVFDVELSQINGGSFRTFISHKGIMKINKSVLKLRELEKKLKLNKSKVYKDFVSRVRKTREDLYNLLVMLKNKGKSVYLYGASTRGNTLLQFCNLDNKLINAAIERNSEKWGKTVASVGIPIISEEQGRAEKPDYMLILPWFFKDEFLEREKNYLKDGGHFIFPLPKVEII
ncbi:MAG: class I SAM-dependent methyltransferase [Patescibacteria group bacterium]